MSSFSDVLKSLKKLPGVGPKLAERLTFHIINMPSEELNSLTQSLLNFKSKIKICGTCGLISEQNPCKICTSNSRDRTMLCVVKSIQDAFFLERSKSYNGLYQVITAIDDLGNEIVEDELPLEPLINRMKGIKEVIFALEPSLESELAIKEIIKRLGSKGVKFTRLAVGIPTGVSLEYIDENTIKNALSYRTNL